MDGFVCLDSFVNVKNMLYAEGLEASTAGGPSKYVIVGDQVPPELDSAPSPQDPPV